MRRRSLRSAIFFSAVSVITLAIANFAMGCGQQPAYAQAPAAKAELKVALSKTQLVAIGSIGEKLAANQTERNRLFGTLHEIEAEIAVEHPGYHFDEATGEIVPDPPKPDAAKADPAKK